MGCKGGSTRLFLVERLSVSITGRRSQTGSGWAAVRVHFRSGGFRIRRNWSSAEGALEFEMEMGCGITQNGQRFDAISARELTCRYGARAAVDAISLSIYAGEIFAFLGPNGSGKTTLFRVLSTLLAPTSGRAEVFGHDVVREPDCVRHALGVAFQSPSLDRKLTCRENLKAHGHLYGLWGRRLGRRIDELLDRFAVADRRRDRVENLSGGLQRRVELAKAMLSQPRLLLLDEPATGLDPVARQELWHDLALLRTEEGVTIALTTHLMDEADQCDRLAILNLGRLVALGTPEELKGQVGGEVICLEAPQPERLAVQIRQAFDAEVQIVDGTLRITQPEAHRFVTKLIEAFPGEIESVRFSRPTLEDVFIARTGQQFRRKASPGATP
jgi:ABC-2 type transport system ATP-binding protein